MNRNENMPNMGTTTGPPFEPPAKKPAIKRPKGPDKWPIDRVIAALNTTIVLDDTCKALTFMAMLLTYTEEDQLNIGLIGESSSGKTIITLETAAYFPEADQIVIAEGTPRALWYDQTSIRGENGVELPPEALYIVEKLAKWVEENPEPERGSKTLWRDKRQDARRALKAEYRQLRPRRFLDLHQKIIILLDQKDDGLLRNLRPLLSHDKKQIEAKLVSTTGVSGSWQTDNTIIQGYPTMVVCSAAYLKNEQEQTRFLLLSPETSQEKIWAVLEYLGGMMGDRKAHRDRIMQDPRRVALMERVREIRRQKIGQVNLDGGLMQVVLDRYRGRSLQPRQPRDFRYQVSLIKGHALLNFDNRRREGDTIWANEDDVKAGIRLYEPIERSNELGLPPEAYRFYVVIIQGQCRKPTRYSRLEQRFREVNGRSISHSRLLQILYRLEAAGLIEMGIRDPLDGRYFCIRER